MSVYKFYEKAPKIQGTLAEAKVDALYEKIDELLIAAKTEIDTFFDPDIDLISGNMAKIDACVREIEKIEDVEYIRFEELYAAIDNWLFDTTYGWAPDGDEDVLAYM